MRGRLTLEALEAAVVDGTIDTVVVALPDMHGRLVGKRYQAEFFLASAHKAMHGCSYLLATDAEMTSVPGYPSLAAGHGDHLLRPDLSTLRRIPWLEGTALVLADAYLTDGETEVPHAPRAILRRQVDRLEALGLHALVAPELEFYVFAQPYAEAHAAGYRGLTPVSPYNEDYHIFQTTREEDLMRAIRTGLTGAGVPVESTRGEGAAGQGELNIRYDAPITTADAQVIAKNGAKEIAFAKGRALTFLAQPATGWAGSSCHLHLSLRTLDGDRPAFLDKDAADSMTPLMRSWIAGLLAHVDAITPFLAPNINSYKRFATGEFAPANAGWSVDDRTAGFRVVSLGTPAQRVECRLGGADLNPYLALAALIAAGIAGVEADLPLPPPGQTGSAIPRTLRAAAEALNQSSMLRAALGDGVIEHYVHAARWEQAEHDRVVTDWEVARGFERS